MIGISQFPRHAIPASNNNVLASALSCLQITSAEQGISNHVTENYDAEPGPQGHCSCNEKDCNHHFIVEN